MSGWEAVISGSLVVLGWIITGRVLLSQSRAISELRERVTWCEAKINGRDR